MSKPKIAIVPGDPSGVGPELIAKLVDMDGVTGSADILLVGDKHLWERGAQQAGLTFNATSISANDVASFSGLAHLDLETISPDDVQVAEVTQAGGTTSLRCLDAALDLAQGDKIDGLMFGPFNKGAMTSAGLNADDEHVYMARYLGFTGYHSEINVLDELMTTRVTSHIGLRDVAELISAKRISNAAHLAHQTLVKAGNENPRIAVAALNPHAGDNGKFGREEIDILAPAIEGLRQEGVDATGPWPSDTVFLKAQKGEVDAVVTMYHDQGQIAIKLLGFDRGVTVAGGLPIPVTTPAHGTAFDIAGKGVANVSATRKAFDLLLRMAQTHKATRDKAA